MYEIIYTDPPWPQRKGNVRKCRPNQGKALDYKTMCLEDIAEYHKPYFEQTATHHNVFMWAIDKYLHDAEQMMVDMGYKLHARMVWDKGNGIAPAFTVRFSHEYLLWFFKPRKMLMPCAEMRGKYTTVLREAATAHSRKPLVAYLMLEAMFPNARRIELFARQRRSGWEAIGNELPGV